MSDIFMDGIDVGYRDDPKWWWDESSEDGFRVANENSDYPEEYFKTDHVPESVIEKYCNHVIRQYELFVGKRLKTIVEFGSGGGWFTSEFKRRGYDITGYEGSNAGIIKCNEKMVWSVERKDLRKYIVPPSEKYNIALCTEVAGHVEPPFSSMLVYNLTTHSDIIWWSSEEPGANKAHLHHSNEQPNKFWVNLFKFYGYEAILLPDEIFNACEYRGRSMFYNKNKFR